MREIIAINSQLKLIERFGNGSRFYKIEPEKFRLQIFNQIRESFKDKPVEILEANGWLRIRKTDKIEEIEQQLKEKINIEDLDEEKVINNEVNILKKAGFVVTMGEIE